MGAPNSVHPNLEILEYFGPRIKYIIGAWSDVLRKLFIFLEPHVKITPSKFDVFVNLCALTMFPIGCQYFAIKRTK